MENKPQNDGLGDFLRKSFEQYEDSPSDDLWNKIEAGLDTDPAVAPVRKGLPVNWFVWAVVCMLVVLAGQYWYFHSDNSKMKDTIEYQEQQLEELNRKYKDAIEQKQTEPERTDPQSPLIDSDQEIPVAGVTTKNTGTVKQPVAAPLTSGTTENSAAAGQRDEKGPAYRAETGSMAEPPENPEVALRPLEEKVNLGQTVMERPVHTSTGMPPFLPLPESQSLAGPFPGLETSLNAAIITPVKSSRYSLGVQYGELLTREKVSSTIQRPVIGRRVFNNQRSEDGFSRYAGLLVKRDLSKGWMLESGVCYRRTQLSFLHRPQLRFKDRILDNVGNQGQEHDFAYLLNTPSGAVEIEVRADQSDPQTQIGENEPLEIEIRTRQRIDQLSFPLLLGYRIGNGRFGLEIKAGVMGNLLLDNTFEITRVAFLDSRFRNSQTRQPRSTTPGLKAFSWDFVGSAGLYCQLAGNWELNLTPTVIRSAGSLHQDRYVESGSLSAGVNAGLVYRF